METHRIWEVQGVRSLGRKCRASEHRKRTNKPTPKPSIDGVGTSEESGAVRPLVTDHAKEAVPKPPSPIGQTPVQHPHTRTKSPTPLPSTPGTTTEIFSTNAAGEMVVTTIEVTKDPRMRGDSSTSKG